MAIQFNCPSCGAMIRVPDAAAGKKGTCPRCSEKLLVPDLATAAGAGTGSPTATSHPGKLELPPLDFQAGRTAPAGARSRTEPQPVAGLPGLGQLPSVAENPTVDATSELGLPPLAVGGSPNIAHEIQRKVRTKQKQVQGAWIIPVICALGLIGFVGWFLWTSQPKLEGELTAHTVRNLEVKPGIIPGSSSGLSADDLDEVLRHLRVEAAHWTSTASKMTLVGTKDGVEVTIAPGTAAHFVAVQPLTNPAFLAYVTQHTAELDKPRLASIHNNAPKLFAAWQTQFAKHVALSNQKDHRDLVALPTLVTGVGYHLEAVVNGNVYPCVYEDADGQVYFLVPNATKGFQMQGRRVAGGSYLPAKFQVKVSGSAAAPSATKKKKLKSKEEREAENEGMNPELYKQDMADVGQEDSDKAGKTQGDALKAGLGDMLTGDKSGQPVFKSKSKSKKPAMLDGDDEMMNDDMPAKSKPNKGATKKMLPKGEMLESSDEMLDQPQQQKRTVPKKK